MRPDLFARVVLTTAMLCFMTASGFADWPMYRGDAGRTASTKEPLPDHLAVAWVHHAAHAPMPAWPRSDRMMFDRVNQPVAVGGTVYFGSSADGKVYALDAKTGLTKWTYYTDGPIRFAPVVWQDRLLVASDDGNLYCLRAADGRLLWRRRGGPSDDMLLGNERMISRWPARGGPVVVDGTVYFGAGIWPSDGIFLYALDAETGKVRWLNDRSGNIEMPQPHGGAIARSGIAAQGYLAAGESRLFVPTGRAVPAAFGLQNGEFVYFRLQRYGHAGGSPILVSGPAFINRGIAFSRDSGKLVERLSSGAIAAVGDVVYHGTENRVTAYQWIEKEKPDRKGRRVRVPALKQLWSVAKVPAGTALIATGNCLVSSGGSRLCRIDLDKKTAVWSHQADGDVRGLAASEGRLYAATEAGSLLCFAAHVEGNPQNYYSQPTTNPYGDNQLAIEAAQQLIALTGVSEGYCVDLGCGNGALAYELAKRTNLTIVAIDDDPDMVREARQRLDAAGMLGTRVTVRRGDPLNSPYPDYCADLVVSGRSVQVGADNVLADEVLRIARPYGGTACLGIPGAMFKLVRGPLAGAGQWTHQYADPGGSCCSADRLVQGTLGMLWFRDVDFDMPQRHGRGPAPLVVQGRMIVEGLDGLCAVSAYNGRELWRYKLDGVLQPYNGDQLLGTAGTNSNFCATKRAVYVRQDDHCLRIDLETGKKLAEFPAPKTAEGKSAAWGFIAVEGNTLFGSLVDADYLVKWRYHRGDMSRLLTESLRLFAMDATTGRLKWTYDAKHSIRHNAIAVGPRRVYLIDRPQAKRDRLQATPDDEKTAQPPGRLLALDARTGRVEWQSDKEIFGTLLALSNRYDALTMAYQPTGFRLPSEVGGRIAVFRASDGKPLWSKAAHYASRPVVNDRTIFAQGGAWDLLTGDERPFPFKRSYGCGILAGGANVMVYRSATLGYFDLTADRGNTDYGGLRPGCWINAIPAAGLVLVPDATAGCQCSYLNKSWVALHPLGRE